MFKRVGLIAVIATAGVMIASVAQAQTWRFALEEVDGSVQDAYAEEFKKRIEERSDGEITVDIYPYGTLGDSSQLTDLVQQDGVQLAFASPGHLASVIPETGVFTLHFLFSDDDEVNEQVLAETESRELLQEAYNEQNLQMLGIIPEGWMVWTGDRAINTPADMQDFKIRTMTSPIVIESYRAYGADPTPMPYAEVYSGLQLEHIDGQVNPVFAIEEMSFHEVQDYLIMAKQAQFITTLIASQGFYEGLPEEQRTLLDEVTDEMRAYIFEMQSDFNEESLETIKQESDMEIITLSDEERSAFRERSLEVREVFIEEVGERGKRILETLDRELRAAEQAKGENS